jgi:hypothetical protein
MYILVTPLPIKRTGLSFLAKVSALSRVGVHRGSVIIGVSMTRAAAIKISLNLGIPKVTFTSPEKK